MNLQEIKDIKFGTPNAVQYSDNFYNTELFLWVHGTYSIRIVGPLKFYTEVVPCDAERVHVDNIKNQYQVESLGAFSATLSKVSVDGTRIPQIQSRVGELPKYMRDTLDEEWEATHGIGIQAVGIASIPYDEQSRRLIDTRNQGAMLQDPSIHEGYVQGAVATGVQNAGSNPAGAGSAILGVGMGVQAGGGFMQTVSASNRAQAAAHPQVQGMSGIGSTTSGGAGAINSSGARFCSDCGTQFGQSKPNFCLQCNWPVARRVYRQKSSQKHKITTITTTIRRGNLISTSHVSAEPGDLAPTVLMPGGLKRTERIAHMLTLDVKMATEVRGMMGFTGIYEGKPLSVMGSGIGQPLSTIYAIELFRFYGVQCIIRVRICGSISPPMQVGDTVVAMTVYTDSYINVARFPETSFAPCALRNPLSATVRAVETLPGADRGRVHVDSVFSEDHFYFKTPGLLEKLTVCDTLGLEMETVAPYGAAVEFGKEALTVLTVSDNLLDNSRDMIPEERGIKFANTLKLAAMVALN